MAVTSWLGVTDRTVCPWHGASVAGAVALIVVQIMTFGLAFVAAGRAAWAEPNIFRCCFEMCYFKMFRLNYRPSAEKPRHKSLCYIKTYCLRVIPPNIKLEISLPKNLFTGIITFEKILSSIIDACSGPSVQISGILSWHPRLLDIA